ncbi:site-2 protease family protein [Anaerosinus massiliensis]|uniref:site-2 protease family protein n=1 Tax=Massilibacillus massiliensis TaxID=1806837 RepID=UPI0018FEBEBD|nr:site-2 protease family protein [Massilibacillus massiliensis]
MIFFAKNFCKRLMVLCMAAVALLKLHTTVTMFISIFISVLCYALPFDVYFAIGFVLLLFAHEFGHIIAAKVVGLRTSPPIFIPFLGAMVHLKRQPVNAKMTANIAIGGPAMGALSALVCIACYFWTDQKLWLTLAYIACILNLFNLIPSEPLDGGKIVVAISPHFWWLGTMMIGLLFFYTYNMLIFIIFLFSLSRVWKINRTNYTETYYQISRKKRWMVFSWYIGLIAVLGIATLYIWELL